MVATASEIVFSVVGCVVVGVGAIVVLVVLFVLVVVMVFLLITVVRADVRIVVSLLA